MSRYCVKEDRLLPKLPVRLSFEIANAIESINLRNYNNEDALKEWNEYIKWVESYISNPVIAWDNMNRYYHPSNKETYIEELGISVGFTIKRDNTNLSYVYVFYIDLKTEDYGLNESIRKNSIVLTESDLRKMVKECLRRIINESEYKPVTHNKTIKLDNGVEVKSLVTLSDGAGMYDIYEDDGCYVVWNRKYKGENNHWYIFPELLSTLKKLPNLPLR